MEEVKYSKKQALEIAKAIHMQGGLDDLVDPKSGKTVGFGLSVAKTFMGIETGGYGGDRELIWTEKMEQGFITGLAEKETYTAQELSKMIQKKGLKIAPDAITAAATLNIKGTETSASEPEKLALETAPSAPAPAVTERETAPKPAQASAEKKPSVVQELFGLDDSEELLKRRKELPGYQGGIINGMQNFVILLISMFANVISGGKAYVEDEKPTPETKKAEKNQEVQKEQHQELRQQVQLAQALEAQDEAQKPKLPDPPRELVINHFGEGGIRRNTEDMQKFQEALAQSHVPDGTNVSPSSSVSNSQHQKVGPDASFGRSIV